MKKNTTPELSVKWWNSNQPDGLSAAKELDKALGEYESAAAKLNKEGPENNLSVCLKALAQIDAAAKKLQGETEKLAKSPPKKTKSTADDYQNTADCLKKYSNVTASARKELEGLSKAAMSDDEDDDDGSGLLGNEKDYQVYLKKTLTRLKKRSMNFAVGLGKKPDEHRFLFHRVKPGKALIAAIKDDTDLKKFTWGVAGGHEEKPTTLVLALEGPQAPGLKKKTEKLFRHFKPLPFNLVMLMVDGEEAEDIDDPQDVDAETGATDIPAPPPPPPPSVATDDPAASFKARLTALLPAIQQAIAAKRPAGDDAKLKASEAGVFARKKDFDAAHRMLDEAEASLAATTTSESTSATTAESAQAQQLRAAMDKLAIRVANQVKANPADGADLVPYLNEFDRLLRSGDLAAAREQVMELGVSLNALQERDAREAAATTAFSPVRYAKIHLEWDARKNTVHGQLETLHKAIVAEFDDVESLSAAKNLDGILARFNDGLGDTLDALRNAADAAQRAPLRGKAADIVSDYLGYLDGSELVNHVEANPFEIDVQVRTLLMPPLDDLQRLLADVTE